MKVLVALAGNGARFKEQGFETIKPLIRTGNMPMIQKVVDSFNWPNAEYYFITRRLHLEQFPYLQTLLESMGHVTVIGNETRGAAETAIACRPIVESDDPFISINCDQIFEWDTKELEQLIKDQPNTSWLTVYQSLDEARHSFALPKVEGLNIFDKYNETYARVNHVSEKTRLGTTSPTATTGFYHFASGKVFKQCVDHALTEPPQYGGEYFMGPIYNELIKRNYNVCMYKVEKPTFWPTGTVADYIEYNHYWVSK